MNEREPAHVLQTPLNCLSVVISHPFYGAIVDIEWPALAYPLAHCYSHRTRILQY